MARAESRERGPGLLRRFRTGVLEADRFARIHFLFFSGLVPLLGAATVRRPLSPGQVILLLGVAVCFHVYAYVLNDVIDLPIDRTQPARQQDPLVRGAIRPWQALAVALGMVPLTIPLTHALGGGIAAHAILGAGFGLMAVYNLWGKRGPVPPITDLVQGLAWGSLAPYAALAVGGEPSALTWTVAGFAAGFILLINGIHGGLRDLANDLARGARNTAIFLGARPVHGGRAHVPAGVVAFAYTVLGGLVLLGMVPLLRNDFGYSPTTRGMMLGVVGGMNLIALVLQAPVFRPGTPRWDVIFRVQLMLVLMILPVLFAPYVGPGIAGVLVLILLISLLPNEYTYRVARLLRFARRPAAEDPSDRQPHEAA